MEYELDDLYKAVYFTLSLNKNKRFTMTELYDEIVTNGSCPELTRSYYTRSNTLLSDACQKTSRTYQNVHFDGSKCHLSVCDEYDMDEIKRIIKNPGLYSFGLDKPYHNGQTILHILCKEGQSELLDELSKSFNIDVTIKNELGQSMLDVIPNDKQDVTKTLFKIVLNQIRDTQNSAITEIKTKNTQLLEVNNNLHNEIISLKEHKRYTDAKLNMVLMLLVGMVGLFVTSLCVQFAPLKYL